MAWGENSRSPETKDFDGGGTRARARSVLGCGRRKELPESRPRGAGYMRLICGLSVRCPRARLVSTGRTSPDAAGTLFLRPVSANL